MPERLRRLEYTFQRLPIYFVTACTHERRPILNKADIHTRLIEFGKEGADHGVWLGAYVLMADHLHAFDGHRPPLQLHALANSTLDVERLSRRSLAKAD